MHSTQYQCVIQGNEPSDDYDQLLCLITSKTPSTAKKLNRKSQKVQHTKANGAKHNRRSEGLGRCVSDALDGEISFEEMEGSFCFTHFRLQQNFVVVVVVAIASLSFDFGPYGNHTNTHEKTRDAFPFEAVIRRHRLLAVAVCGTLW